MHAAVPAGSSIIRSDSFVPKLGGCEEGPSCQDVIIGLARHRSIWSSLEHAVQQGKKSLVVRLRRDLIGGRVLVGSD